MQQKSYTLEIQHTLLRKCENLKCFMKKRASLRFPVTDKTAELECLDVDKRNLKYLSFITKNIKVIFSYCSFFPFLCEHFFTSFFKFQSEKLLLIDKSTLRNLKFSF